MGSIPNSFSHVHRCGCNSLRYDAHAGHQNESKTVALQIDAAVPISITVALHRCGNSGAKTESRAPPRKCPMPCTAQCNTTLALTSPHLQADVNSNPPRHWHTLAVCGEISRWESEPDPHLDRPPPIAGEVRDRKLRKQFANAIFSGCCCCSPQRTECPEVPRLRPGGNTHMKNQYFGIFSCVAQNGSHLGSGHNSGHKDALASMLCEF